MVAAGDTALNGVREAADRGGVCEAPLQLRQWQALFRSCDFGQLVRGDFIQNVDHKMSIPEVWRRW